MLEWSYLQDNSFNEWYLSYVEWPQKWEKTMGKRGDTPLIENALSLLFSNPSEVVRTSLFWFFALLSAAKIYTQLEKRNRWLAWSGVFAVSLVFWIYRNDIPVEPRPTALFGASVSLIAFVAACVGFALLLFRKASDKKAVLCLILLASVVVCSWLHAYPLADHPHMVWGTAFSYAFLLALTFHSLKKNTVATLIFIAPFLWNAVPQTTAALWQVNSMSLVPITISDNSVLTGLYIREDDERHKVIDHWASVEFIDTFAQRFPEVPVVNFTDHGMFAAAAKNLKMPDQYYIWWGWLGFPEFVRFSFDTRRAFIREHHPLIIAHSSMKETMQRLVDEDGYVFVKELDDNVILLPSAIAAKL